MVKSEFVRIQSIITSINKTLFEKARKQLNFTTMEQEKNYPIAHTSEDKLFTIVEKSEKEVFICVGNQLASSKTFKDLKQAKNYITRKPWELLVNVMCIVNEKMKNYETSKQ